MADVGHVHPDLVGTAGENTDGMTRLASPRGPVQSDLVGAFRASRPPFSSTAILVFWVGCRPMDASMIPSLPARTAVNDGQVDLVRAPVPQNPRPVPSRAGSVRATAMTPGGVLVQPVHDAGPLLVHARAVGGQVRVVMQQVIDQGRVQAHRARDGWSPRRACQPPTGGRPRTEHSGSSPATRAGARRSVNVRPRRPRWSGRRLRKA